jgi:hypothetical protein
MIRLALVSIIVFTSSLMASYETPDYKVISAEGAFEIRDYPELTVVSAPMPQRGADGSFMSLFRFISGKNDRSEKISMTTPVLMSGAESGTMSFIVPKAVAAKGVLLGDAIATVTMLIGIPPCGGCDCCIYDRNIVGNLS